MANGYVTLTELKATLSMSGETFADADLQLAIDAASRAIDRATNRRFFPDTVAVERRYLADCPILPIDDLISLVSLSVDGELWTEDVDFVLEPLNAPENGEPWTRVRALRTLRGTVTIDGLFGWSAPPDQIRAAAGILAAKIAKRAREAPFGVAAFGVDGTAVRISATDPDIRFLIERFSHIPNVA